MLESLQRRHPRLLAPILFLNEGRDGGKFCTTRPRKSFERLSRFAGDKGAAGAGEGLGDSSDCVEGLCARTSPRKKAHKDQANPTCSAVHGKTLRKWSMSVFGNVVTLMLTLSSAAILSFSEKLVKTSRSGLPPVGRISNPSVGAVGRIGNPSYRRQAGPNSWTVASSWQRPFNSGRKLITDH